MQGGFQEGHPLRMSDTPGVVPGRARRDSVCASGLPATHGPLAPAGRRSPNRKAWQTWAPAGAGPPAPSRAGRSESAQIDQMADRAISVGQVTHDQTFAGLSLDQEQADPALLQGLVESTVCHRVPAQEAPRPAASRIGTSAASGGAPAEGAKRSRRRKRPHRRRPGAARYTLIPSRRGKRHFATSG